MTSISGIRSTYNLIGTTAGHSDNPKPTIASPSNESSKVTLSDDAKVFARFASKGIAVAVRELSSPLSGGISNNNPGQMATDKSISKEDFLSLLSTLGVNENGRDKLMSGFDNDNDGTISHDEILKVFAGTSSEDSSLSQTVLSLMDLKGNGDGRVDGKEFVKLSTAFYDAEK
jgi:hypothetical protein